MATTDLATRDPMMADRRASSGFGFDGYNYDRESMGGGSGAVTPYVPLLPGRDVCLHIDDLMKVGTHSNHHQEHGRQPTRNTLKSTSNHTGSKMYG